MTFDQCAFNDVYFETRVGLGRGNEMPVFLLRTPRCSVDSRLQSLGKEESLSIRRWRSLNVITESSCKRERVRRCRSNSLRFETRESLMDTYPDVGE